MHTILKLSFCCRNATSHLPLRKSSCVVKNVRSYATGGKLRNRGRSIGISGYCMLAIPVATFGLGTWQVQRRQWKLDLIQKLNAKTNASPVDFPLNLDDLAELEYRRVKVVGEFDHSKEIYIQSRSLLSRGTETGGGLISAGIQSGTLVVTPFHLADRDLAILVNRGWVSRKNTNPKTRQRGQIEGEIELVGVVRNTEARAPFVPENKMTSRNFYYRDVNAMAELCNTSPIFLDAVFDSTVENGPIGGQTRVALRNEHMSYIITWYALCAATAYLWHRKYIRGKAIM